MIDKLTKKRMTTIKTALTILEAQEFETTLLREYQTAIKAMKQPGKKIYCGKKSIIDGKHTSVSWQIDTVQLFNSLGFSNYKAGNDAPRHGRAGDWVMVLVE